MQIRLATIDDARGIAEVHVLSWQAAYSGLFPEEVLEALSIDRRETIWRENLSKGLGETRVAVENGQILGWISTGHCRDPDAASEFGELWALYVRPEAWRRGIGQALWDAGRATLKSAGFKCATLWVLERNEPARRFYEANGFAYDPGHDQTIERGGVVQPEIRLRCNL